MSNTQPPLKLHVRNVLGIVKADVDLHGILLVAGINGAGKSSLIEACASVMCLSPLARGMTTKKAAAALLHEGMDRGSISLDYGPGTIRITYPDCQIEQSGRPTFLGSPLGIGSARFMALNVAERGKEITQRFKTEPTLDDLRKWSADHPEAGGAVKRLPDGTVQDPMAAIWQDIDMNGWDPVHKTAVEYGSRLKGRWEAVTGQSWGSKVSRDWCPSPLLPGEEYDLAAAQQEAQRTNAVLEQLLGHAAVGAADIARLDALSGTLEEAQQRQETVRRDGDALATQLEDLVVKKNAKDAPVDTSNLPKCPHCNKSLRLVNDAKRGYTFVEKAPDPLPPAELKKAKVALDELNRQIEHLRGQIADNGKQVMAATSDVRAAQDARAALAKAQAAPKVAEEDLANAREAKLDADRKVSAIDAMQKATAIYKDWLKHALLIEALAPSGIRKTVMARALNKVNTRLGELSTQAKFYDVALTDDLNATYGGRVYQLLSESERWRCDLVFTALFGQEEKARVILVDRFDVIHPQARPAALFLLRHLGVPALVCMTAKSSETVPDLARAKIGANRWLNAGTLETVTS